jgi:hypothetical protein
MEIEENYKYIIFSQLHNNYIPTETLVSVEISSLTYLCKSSTFNIISKYAR